MDLVLCEADPSRDRSAAQSALAAVREGSEVSSAATQLALRKWGQDAEMPTSTVNCAVQNRSRGGADLPDHRLWRAILPADRVVTPTDGVATFGGLGVDR
jgi:hypothetical protein